VAVDLRTAAFTRTEKATLEALASVLLPEGNALPGASATRTAETLDTRAASWDLHVIAGVKWLLRIWNVMPLASRHRTTFARMSTKDQQFWTENAYHSRSAARRLQITALKQLILLEWASSPEIEDALAYDYRCRRDDEVHGTTRTVPEPDGAAFPAGAEPGDYQRPGPAVTGGTIPLHLAERRSHRPVDPADTALSTIEWPDLSDGALLTPDVVVIGSGAGGAVVATYLAEAGMSVVVLEEGEHATSADFDGPMFCRFQRFCRDNGTTQVWGKPPIPLPLGKVVGGTTVVNSGTCFRAPDRVLERWAGEFGIAGARADELAAHYAPLEDFLNVRPVPWELLGPNGMAAHRGAVALGYSGGPLLRNIADCHGCGQCAFGCPTDAKQAMHVSYLPRAQRAGATIVSRCRVDRVLVEDGRAYGVTATLLGPDGRHRGTLKVIADDVVVSAGAVNTPVLLHRSDVPDPSGQTGRNLRVHPATGVGGIFPETLRNWKGTLQSYYIDEFFDSHDLMFEATTTVPGIGAGSLPGIGALAMNELARIGNLATLGFYVSDTSRGRVWTLRNGRPLITYRLNELDARRMFTGTRIAAEVLLEAGATSVYPGIPGIDSIQSRSDLDALRTRTPRAEHLKLTAFHPMGTVRMGADPSGSVVAPNGAHHATERLWVADASTFPTCVGVNPQMTIMAFAKSTAESLVSSRGG
jgi:choline dehydrogenase-like flavoprotein